MSIQQKQAVFIIVVSMLLLTGYILARPILGQHMALGAFTLIGAFSLLSAGYRLFVSRKGFILDERDRDIRHRSFMTTVSVFMSYHVFGSLALFWYYHTNETIPMVIFANYILYGWILTYCAWGVTTLVFYRQGEAHG
jgi:hypothetical protein